MEKIKFVFFGLLISIAAHANGFSQGAVLKKLEKNQFVIASFKQVQIFVGRSSSCKKLQLVSMGVNDSGDLADFEVFGDCTGINGNDSDGQFHIKGTFYSSNGEPIIKLATFDYAG